MEELSAPQSKASPIEPGPVPPIFEQIYVQNAEMIRHYDRLKYTAWTVYIAIIAGLYIAADKSDIDAEEFLGVTCAASLYFIMLLFRIQRNYKVFYTSISNIERYIQLKNNMGGSTGYRRLFPFLGVDDLNPDNFHQIKFWDRALGFVPYFRMKVGFFLITPLVLIFLYISQNPKTPPVASEKIGETGPE